MQTKFYSIKLFLIALLLSLGMATKTNAQFAQVDMDPPFNLTKGGVNVPASPGDILQYVIRTTNLTTADLVASKFYNSVPEGTTYVTGSTSLNGWSIPDVNGKMPYIGGGYINSISNTTGRISPGAFAKVSYQLKVTASSGEIRNQAAVDVTSGGVSDIDRSNIVSTPVVP